MNKLKPFDIVSIQNIEKKIKEKKVMLYNK